MRRQHLPVVIFVALALLSIAASYYVTAYQGAVPVLQEGDSSSE